MNTNTAPRRAAGSPSFRGHVADRVAVVRVGLLTAAAAALAAWVLTAVFHLSQNAVVLTVITVAFTASWTITNRRPTAQVQKHSVTVIPARVSSQRV